MTSRDQTAFTSLKETRRLVIFLAGFPALEKQLLKAIKTFPFSLLRCLSGFFSKKACQINLLFAAASKSFSVRSMRNQKFSAREKVLDTSLVSSNYWHAKVPCSSCLVLARLCSVGKDLSSTWWESRCYFLRWWYDCYFDGSRATNLATVRRSFFLLSLEVCHSTTTIQHSTT